MTPQATLMTLTHPAVQGTMGEDLQAMMTKQRLEQGQEKATAQALSWRQGAR